MTAPSAPVIEHESIIETLDLSKITIKHERYCRSVSSFKVALMIKRGFDPKALQFISLHMEPDGTYVILDGQHRLALLKKIGIQKVRANIFIGLTYEQKSKLTDDLNFTNRQTAEHKFRYRYNYREPRAVGIVKVLREFGLNVPVEEDDPSRKAPGFIHCVAALDEAYADLGEAGFRAVVGIIYQAWGASRHAWVSDIVLGMRQFWARYGEVVHTTRLIEKLRRTSIDELWQEAGSMGGRSEQRSSRIGKAVVKIYNMNLRVNRLSPWQDYTGTRLYPGERTDWANNSQLRRKLRKEDKQAEETQPEEPEPKGASLDYLY